MPVDVICVPEMGDGRMPGGGVGFGIDGVFGTPNWDKAMFLLRNDILGALLFWDGRFWCLVFEMEMRPPVQDVVIHHQGSRESDWDFRNGLVDANISLPFSSTPR